MDQFLRPDVILCILALLCFGLQAAVNLRNLLVVPIGREHIHRAEYEKDEIARKEQFRAVALKCRNNARLRAADRKRNDEKFDLLVNSLGELKVQLARLATCMEERREEQTSSILKEK